MTEKEIIELITKGEPFKELSDIRIRAVEPQPKGLDPNVRPDVAITMEFTGTIIALYGEIKTQVTRKIIEETGRLLARSNINKTNIRYVLICPFLSPESQKYCQENQIDFIDLCGNILIRIPGRVFIQRLNRSNIFKTPQLLRNPFSGASSRVLRVLLQSPLPRIIDAESRKFASLRNGRPIPLQKGQWWKPPKPGWSVTDIEKELIRESGRLSQRSASRFQLSMASISKTIQALEEEILIRRDGMKILVPDPRQLLFRWAEKYKELYQRIRRSSWLCKNPFSFDLKSSIKGLLNQFPDPNIDVIVTGSSAASLNAPFVNIDRIEAYIMNNTTSEQLCAFAEKTEQGKGPEFLFLTPYDEGVAMYSQELNGINIVSNIQSYLDCYARGGRDSKQAEYLLNNIIEKEWAKKDGKIVE